MKATAKYPEPHRGANDLNQWYKLNPQRWKEEKRLMSEDCPDFEQYFDGSYNACWRGTVRVEKVHGTAPYIPKYQELDVKIICPANYPKANPIIEDTKGTLTQKSPHTLNKTSLCYYFGRSSELDFENTHKIADLYQVIQAYMIKQSIWEEKGIWPGEEHHGIGAFIKREYEGGCIDPKEICLCRMEGKTYDICHLVKVMEAIAAINRFLRQIYGKKKLGRNMKCPCGSKRKFKKCCIWKNYYGVIRKDVIQLYPELTTNMLEKLLKKLDEEFIKKLGGSAAPASFGEI